MNYVGVDLHKEASWFCILDDQGKKLDSKKVSNKPEILKPYFRKIPKPFKLAVETTYNWYFFVDIAEDYAEEVFLANSYELKAFAKRNKKNDKIDARLIAQVLRQGYLPTVSIPDRGTRQIREMLRYRMKLVTDRSRCIFRLKALLDKLGLDSGGDFTTQKALNQLAFKDCSSLYQKLIVGYRDQIGYLSQKLTETRRELEAISHRDQDMKNLMTIPGISHFSAALIKSEIIEISRFKSFNRLCAYAGLAPRVHASARKIHHGPLNRNRCRYLQWILIEIVHHFIRSMESKKTRFEALKRKKGYHSSKIVMAREMLRVIYHVLKDQRTFIEESRFKIQSMAAAALQGV